MSQVTFLRRVLAIDALSCAVMGLALMAGAGPLAALFGYPAPFIRTAGMLLLPIALFIGFVASRPVPAAALVWLVIVGNLGWVVESLVVIGTTPGVTALGIAFTLAQATFVLLMAILEYVGVRRLPARV